MLIQGDLNADTAYIPTANNLITEQGWVDCGAVASWWGGGDTARRDFMIVNQDILPSVNNNPCGTGRPFPNAAAIVHGNHGQHT